MSNANTNTNFNRDNYLPAAGPGAGLKKLEALADAARNRLTLTQGAVDRATKKEDEARKRRDDACEKLQNLLLERRDGANPIAAKECGALVVRMQRNDLDEVMLAVLKRAGFLAQATIQEAETLRDSARELRSAKNALKRAIDDLVVAERAEGQARKLVIVNGS